jgi:hypothetical protein
LFERHRLPAWRAELLQSKTGVIAAAVVALIGASPAFEVFLFDTEMCIAERAALRSASA